MIPSITPPTDNLYKFISLFGLTIFLFASYNLGIVYDQSAASKMRIEDLKVEVQKKLMVKEIKINNSIKSDSDSIRFKPSKIRLMNIDLKNLEKEIIKLDPITYIELKGSISKINVKIDALWLKEVICFTFVGVGCIVMVFGFVFWKRKEQNLRDKMLSIEHESKLEKSVRERKVN